MGNFLTLGEDAQGQLAQVIGIAGDDVHEVLRARHEGFVHAISDERPHYLLDRFDRAPA